MDKIKGQLAGVAALLGVIAAIGGGFVKYGEIVTKLDALENADTSHTHKVGEHTHDTEHSHTATLINKKEIELIKVQIEEIKVKASNPLAN